MLHISADIMKYVSLYESSYTAKLWVTTVYWHTKMCFETWIYLLFTDYFVLFVLPVLSSLYLSLILSAPDWLKAPIICGREPTSSAEEKKLGSERSAELSAKVNQASLFLLKKFVHTPHYNFFLRLYVLNIMLYCSFIFFRCISFYCFWASWVLITFWWSLTDIQFILRRTNALLSNHLPPKVCLSICLNLLDSLSCVRLA